MLQNIVIGCIQINTKGIENKGGLMLFTQKELIKKHLQTNKNGITSLEAIQKYGATRLSGIIYQLKHKDNLNIITERIPVQTIYGTTRIARYKLIEGKHHEQY